MPASAYTRAKQPEQVRRALLDCAATIAMDHGVSGITVQAVAAAVSITAPLFLLVMVFQKQLVSGLTAGAVKG